MILDLATKQAIARHVLDTIPAEGRILTGTVAGMEWAASKNQRDAYWKAVRKAVRQAKRGQA